MIYNIVAVSDIHWGVINPTDQKQQLSFILDFLRNCPFPIDLLVIVGDYWDSKLSLNSKDAIIATQWMYDLVDICEKNNTKIRIVQGTMDHDNDQLQVFLPLSNENFKIFFTTTTEETLPGLTCIYAPDELLTTNEYEDTYLDQILQIKDLGFFHGSFDVVYGKLLEAKPEMYEQKNVIFRYKFHSPQIKGPLIAGHWHDGGDYDHLYYIRSPFRWAFLEDEPKGFIFLSYDTDTSDYYLKRVENPLAIPYVTYEVYTSVLSTKEDYQKILDEIQSLNDQLQPQNGKLRILFYITDDKKENDIFLSALRQQVLNHPNCKITVKNKLRDKRRREEKKHSEDELAKVGFLKDNNIQYADKIHDFITATNPNAEVPLDFIQKKIDQVHMKK